VKAQEEERERTVQAAREKAEREAAEEEEQRLAEIARKEKVAAEAARKKEMLAKIPEPDQMKLDATPCEIVLLSALCSGKLYKEGTQVSKLTVDLHLVRALGLCPNVANVWNGAGEKGV